MERQVFTWAALYFGSHLFIYILVLRHMRAYVQEKVIFLYHVVPAAAVACILLWLRVVDMHREVSEAVIAVVISLHGIYSLSFLELWSLAEGSYSLSIVEHVDTVHAAGAEIDLAALQRIGVEKRENRIRILQWLRLVVRRGDHLELTPPGRLFAVALSVIAWIANVKETA